MSLIPNKDKAEVVLESSPYYAAYALEPKWNIRLYIRIKRAMDLLLAGSGLLLLSPVFFLLALIIKIEDPRGSIIFSQVRVGKGERTFRMYKFRSMVANAEELLPALLDQNEIDGAMFKMKKDPRVTKIGYIIRKTSLDELPQLWNVIRGDMSLVGPRPPLPREVEIYTTYDKQRLRVTPGCTGLWQISGRNNIDFPQMVELDLEYIRNRSIINDLKIIIRTILMLSGSKGAY
ncbi:sugar transferase [Paenibacillus herberti]|uniref:Multidrug MFS transporter n=1 Tax=Paenibacillus herberti TaxID=1619309 RepID=A0A229NUZ5_9BACL|nr:sugar transferase [Paenibacillus herberti]OXM13702.1 multidrug MFS transporter [Paenibacillus herberti]